jgi:hypothetical protein
MPLNPGHCALNSARNVEDVEILRCEPGLLFCRLNPAHSAGRKNYQLVAKIRLQMLRQQREQQHGNVFRGSRVSPYPNHPEMFGQRKYHPVPKMTIKRDQCSLFLYRTFKNLCVISPRLAGFGCTENIMPGLAQGRCQFGPQHLIEVKAHGGLRRVASGDFRVQNGLPGVLEDRLNVRPRQFRIAAQQGIPRFTVSQLLKDGGHGNACALDDRLAAAHTGIDFNALAHPFYTSRTASKRQALNGLEPRTLRPKLCAQCRRC